MKIIASKGNIQMTDEEESSSTHKSWGGTIHITNWFINIGGLACLQVHNSRQNEYRQSESSRFSFR